MYRLRITGDIRVEIWRRCKDYPKCEISNKNGWRHFNTKKEIEGKFDKRGYRRVRLGTNRSAFFSRLVAKAFPEFCGEWFEGCQVHHKDFDPKNNAAENLIILTPSEHQKYHYAQKIIKPYQAPERGKAISQAKKGIPNLSSRKPINQFSLNGILIKRWNSISEINKKLGYSTGQICDCCKGNNKTAHGFLWSYAD